MKIWKHWKLERSYGRLLAELAKETNQKKIDEIICDLQIIEYELYILDWPHLSQKADYWGIQVPSEDWKTHSLYGQPYLDKSTQARIRKSIRDERRRTVKEWSTALFPFWRLIAAIAAATIAAIAFIFR